MSAESQESNTGSPMPAAANTAAQTSGTPAVAAGQVSRALVLALGVVAVLGLLLGGLLWDRLSTLQEQLTRQTTDAGAQAVEARTLVRQTEERERELAARLAVMEARLGEVVLQRGQLEELMQSLSRSRDENLVADIDSAIRLAQQQAQLTGSVEPLLAALRTAEQRVQRVPQARLAPLQRALARDMSRIKATPVTDVPRLLARIDELTRLADELPLANAVARAPEPVAPARQGGADLTDWWRRAVRTAYEEWRALVRVSRIDHPDAVLLSPEQSFFVRENLKFMLLNARLGLMARQVDAARADLAKAAWALEKYFDRNARATQAAVGVLQQTQAQLKTMEMPRVDETLAALAMAAAGR